jgi:hypothetical protein
MRRQFAQDRVLAKRVQEEVGSFGRTREEA